MKFSDSFIWGAAASAYQAEGAAKEDEGELPYGTYFVRKKEK